MAGMLTQLNDLELFYRLGAAALITALIGIERESHDSDAGLRTHLLVGLGSALFTLVSAYGFTDFVHSPGTSLDPTRIAAQIASGIGFVGAGVIIKDKGSVRGLTTASSLWISAAVGMACGAGFYPAAFIASGIALLTLGPLSWVKRRWFASVASDTSPSTAELALRLGVVSRNDLCQGVLDQHDDDAVPRV